jgi:hypothetical protein
VSVRIQISVLDHVVVKIRRGRGIAQRVRLLLLGGLEHPESQEPQRDPTSSLSWEKDSALLQETVEWAQLVFLSALARYPVCAALSAQGQPFAGL